MVHGRRVAHGAGAVTAPPSGEAIGGLQRLRAVGAAVGAAGTLDAPSSAIETAVDASPALLS